MKGKNTMKKNSLFVDLIFCIVGFSILILMGFDSTMSIIIFFAVLFFIRKSRNA